MNSGVTRKAFPTANVIRDGDIGSGTFRYIQHGWASASRYCSLIQSGGPVFQDRSRGPSSAAPPSSAMLPMKAHLHNPTIIFTTAVVASKRRFSVQFYFALPIPEHPTQTGAKRAVSLLAPRGSRALFEAATVPVGRRPVQPQTQTGAWPNWVNTRLFSCLPRANDGKQRLDTARPARKPPCSGAITAGPSFLSPARAGVWTGNGTCWNRGENDRIEVRVRRPAMMASASRRCWEGDSARYLCV